MKGVRNKIWQFFWGRLKLCIFIAWLRKSVFIISLILTSVIGVSVRRILITWAFMEINILLFIPLLRFYSFNQNPHMLRLKYFFIQALASIVLFIRILFLNLISSETFIIILFISLSVMWKIGLPPFHGWLFSLIIDLDWSIFFLLASWQKVLPFFLVSQILFSGYEIFIFLSLLVRVLGSFFQSRIKKLLIFSSIFTGAWILSSMIITKIMWVLVLVLYSTILIFCISLLRKRKIFRKDSENSYLLDQRGKLHLFLLLLSIAGLPPFMGFFIKLGVLFILMERIKLFISISLIFSSVVIIFMYSRIFLRTLNIKTISNKNFFRYRDYKNFSFFLIIYLLSPIIIIGL